MNILGCLDKATAAPIASPVRMLPRWTPMRWATAPRAFRLYFPALPFAFALTAEQNVEVPAVYAGLERKQRCFAPRSCCNGWGWKTVQSISGTAFGWSATARQHRAGIDDGGQVILADEPTGALDSHSGER